MKRYAVLFVLMVCYVWLTTVQESMAAGPENNLTVYTLYTLEDWNDIVKKRIKTAIQDKSTARYFFVGSSNEFSINEVVKYMNTLDPLDKKYIIYYVESMHSQVNKDLNELFDRSVDPIISKALVKYKSGDTEPTVDKQISIPKDSLKVSIPKIK